MTSVCRNWMLFCRLCERFVWQLNFCNTSSWMFKKLLSWCRTLMEKFCKSQLSVIAGKVGKCWFDFQVFTEFTNSWMVVTVKEWNQIKLRKIFLTKLQSHNVGVAFWVVLRLREFPPVFPAFSHSGISTLKLAWICEPYCCYSLVRMCFESFACCLCAFTHSFCLFICQVPENFFDSFSNFTAMVRFNSSGAAVGKDGARRLGAPDASEISKFFCLFSVRIYRFPFNRPVIDSPSHPYCQNYAIFS